MEDAVIKDSAQLFEFENLIIRLLLFSCVIAASAGLSLRIWPNAEPPVVVGMCQYLLWSFKRIWFYNKKIINLSKN